MKMNNGKPLSLMAKGAQMVKLLYTQHYISDSGLRQEAPIVRVRPGLLGEG
jgi:hypothetical protein